MAKSVPKDLLTRDLAKSARFSAKIIFTKQSHNDRGKLKRKFFELPRDKSPEQRKGNLFDILLSTSMT